jgi:hypothetical protein
MASKLLPQNKGDNYESRRPGLPLGLTATHADQVNTDMLAFLRSVEKARKIA